MKKLLGLLVLAFALTGFSPAADACSVSGLTITPGGNNNYSFSASGCGAGSEYEAVLKYKDGSGTLVKTTTQTKTAAGSFSFGSSATPTGNGPFTAELEVTPRNYIGMCLFNTGQGKTNCKVGADIMYESCLAEGGGFNPLNLSISFLTPQQCLAQRNSSYSSCDTTCSGYGNDGFKALTTVKKTASYNPFFDNSSITTTPTTSATRKINLFPNSTDVSWNASSSASYYIKAEIKNSSGSIISTQTSSTVARSGSTVAFPTKTYTVPSYGTYSVDQKLYREQGSTDLLVDSKTTTGLTFSCQQMAFESADTKDGNVQDGQVGLRSRPRVASCHGSANLAINVKNSSGTSVYTTNVSVSSSSTDLSTQYRTLQFGALANGTYTVTQTLSKSGFTTQSRNDTLTVDFFDDSTITTTPTTSATRKINLFPNSTDVAFDASSNGSYYIKATIKNSAGSTVSTQTSSTVSNSGSTVALPTKVYTASSYDTYSVTQELYREAGSTDILVDTKTTTGLSFACPAMAINAADAKDGNVSDGQVGLRSNPRVASCHGSATLALVVKNSSGTTVYSTSASVSSSGTELATVPKTFQFGALPNGNYTVTQTLSKSGHTTQTRNDTLTVAFFDDSTITTTPTTSATRTINLFPNSTDVAFDASSNGSYYIQAEVKNSSGTVLTTQTSSTVANSGSTVALPTKSYTVPDYGNYEVVQRLYREAGSTDTLVDTKTTTGLSFGCTQMSLGNSDAHDGDVSDGQVGLRSNPWVSKCNGVATLSVVVKNSSGTSVYSNSVSVSTTAVENAKVPKTFQFGALPNGSYSVTQTLSKSGFTTKSLTNTLVVAFFDDSTITTTPTTSATRKINLFPNSTDVAFDASSNGSYYIKATVKNSAGATVSTQTSSTVANSGSTVALPTKVYTAPTYGVFSVVQELFREAGSTDTLVDTKTTTGLSFACPAMTISNISSLDVDGSDGSHGFNANPAVASCHGSATLSVVIKNSSGTTVKTLANQTVSSSSTEPSVQSRTYTFDDLPDGTYSVVQTLTASGHTTATKTNSFVAQFFDNSSIAGTPTGTAPRTLDLFEDAVDVNVNTSSFGTYYIVATVRNSSGAVVTTRNATPALANLANLNLAHQGFSLPSYDTYSVEQKLYREAGATDTLLETKLTTGITFGCPAMSVSAISSIDVDGSDGSHGFTANPAIASCHGNATFNLVVKNGSGTTVYTGPAKTVSSTSVEPTIKPQSYTFADLPSGTYTVQQTLTASGHTTQTRNDPFVAEFYDNSQISTTPTTSAPRNIDLFTQSLDAVIDSSSPGSYYITAEIKDGSGAVVSTQTSATVAGSSTALSLPAKTFAATQYDTYSVTQRLYRENGATDTLLDTETTTGLTFACPAMDFGAITNVDSDKSDGTLSFGSRPRVASCHGNANLALTMKDSSGTVVYSVSSVPVSTSSVELITQTKTYNTMDLIDGTYSIEQVLTSPGHDTATQVDSFVVQFFDNSNITTTPTTAPNRTMDLFIDIMDAEFDASRDGDYYIVADIKDSSDTVIKTLTTPQAANSGSNIQLAAANYVVPQYGNYEVEQRLYRELGATDLLVDTKTTTGLNFACPSLAFFSADTKDGDVADGQVGLRSRPRAASCHGSASLAVDVKDGSGTSVYTTTVPVSAASVDLETVYKTLQFGALADGTYTVSQTLSASGFTSSVQNDSLTVSYYDDSTITTTPLAEPTRNVRLFTEPYDVDVDSSSNATYYISAEIRDASDALIATEVSTTNSVDSNKVAIPLVEYTVPEYGLYKITQKLYRETGATDELVDTKLTELSFQCPAFSFQPITDVDTDKSDGTLAFTSRPGVASCHGAANLEVVIKNESGSVVYSRAVEPASASSVEVTYLSKVYNTMDLEDGTYTVEQTLTASGIPSKQQIDTFVVDFYDTSKLNTVPVEAANHVIDFFSQNPDVDFDSSSVADYYVKTTVKDSSDTTIHTESTTEFTASGSDHSIVSKSYTAPDYENYTVVQELFRKGTTDLLVHSRTTAIEFACPEMSINGIVNKDTDGSDGQLGFTARPRLAKCHENAMFGFIIKNSSGEIVYSPPVVDVSSSAVDFEVLELPYTFNSLPDGDYTVEQSLGLSGTITQTRTDVFTVDFWDNSTLTTTPVTEAVRKILLNNDPQDVAVDASSLGEYYIISKIYDSGDALVSTQTSSTALASNNEVDYSVQPFIVPDYGSYKVVQELYRERGTTDALLDTVTTSDLSFSCPNPVFNNLLVTDIDGTDGNHSFTVRPELSVCNGSANLATVIKDSQGTTVLTLPNKSLTSSSVELSVSLQAYTFDALQGGEYTVEQTLSGSGFDTITRNDPFSIVCEDPTLDGISLIDTDGTDGKHGFTVNGKLSSCNAPSELTVTVKNESGTTVYTTPDLPVNSSALTLQTFAEQVEFNVMPPGNYTVLQSFMTSTNQLITRTDPLTLTCNVFTAAWADPSSSESPQDEFNINALVTSSDECNGTVTANLEVKDGSTVVYSSTEKTVTSGLSANGDLGWNFSQAQLDDTTLDIKLTLTNANGVSKVLNDQLVLTCPSLFTPNTFGYDQATQKFSLNVAAGRACNGQGTIELTVNNPSDNYSEIGSANSPIDLSGSTSSFNYDLPITLPQNPAGTYVINGIVTDAKGSIKYFTHFFDVESDNVNTCSIDSVSPFDFDETQIGYTFGTSNCTNAVSFSATLVIKDEQGNEVSSTTQGDVSSNSSLEFDSALMPTQNGLYTGELTVRASETISMCMEGTTCLQQSQLIFEGCMRDRSGNVYECQLVSEGFLEVCERNCNDSGNSIDIDSMTVTSQHLVYDDTSKIVTIPGTSQLSIHLFDDAFDVQVITSTYGDYTIKATILDSDSLPLTLIEQGPKTATSTELAFETMTYEVPDYGTYQIRQELYRDGKLIDMRQDAIVLSCLDPTLNGLSDVNLDSQDNFIDFNVNYNAAACNGTLSLDVKIKDDVDNMVYESPSLYNLGKALNDEQSADTLDQQLVTVPVLDRGSYTVTTILSDGFGMTVTRDDLLEISCEKFAAGLSDPALIEPTDDNFRFRADIYTADSCNGELKVSYSVKHAQDVLHQSNEQSFNSNEAPINLEQEFTAAIDGVTVDVTMTVENTLGDIETYTQQVQIGCPSEFIFDSIAYDQSTSEFKLGLQGLRACNGVGTIEYNITDVNDNDRVINSTSSSIDLTGASELFVKQSPLDLPANDVVGQYRVFGTVTDAHGSEKPFDYLFNLICPPWQLEGVTIGSPRPAPYRINSEIGTFDFDAHVAKTDVCHADFKADDISFEIIQDGSNEPFVLGEPVLIEPVGANDNLTVRFSPSIYTHDFYGASHAYKATISESEEKLLNEYEGQVQVACPIASLELDTNWSDPQNFVTSISRDPRFSCQAELSLYWQGSYFNEETQEYVTLVTSEQSERTTENTISGALTWNAAVADLGGTNIKMEPYIQFYSPFEVTKQSDHLVDNYKIPCQPANITGIHSASQDRSKNTLDFKATYTPLMTCNGLSSVVVIIKDLDGNEVTSGTARIDSPVEADVDFQTSYLPEGQYTAEFSLYDAHGNHTVNEIPFTTPCSNPGFIGSFRGERSYSSEQYVLVDIPSCMGAYDSAELEFQNPDTLEMEQIQLQRVSESNQDMYFFAKLEDFGLRGSQSLDVTMRTPDFEHTENLRLSFFTDFEATPYVTNIQYNPDAPLIKIDNFSDIYLKYNQTASLVDQMMRTVAPSSYEENTSLNTLSLKDNSQSGFIDLQVSLHDPVNEAMASKLTLYFQDTNDSVYQLLCNKSIDEELMATLDPQTVALKDPRDFVLNSFDCKALLAPIAETYTFMSAKVRTSDGKVSVANLNVVGPFTSQAAGSEVSQNISNMIAITDVESNKSYGALLWEQSKSVKPISVKPMKSGIYTAHFNPQMANGRHLDPVSISFEYEQPSSEISTTIPYGTDLTVDAQIPNSPNATFAQIKDNQSINVTIEKLSGDADYTFNGQTVTSTPITVTMSKISIFSESFQLLVKPIGEVKTALYRIKPIHSSVIDTVELTVKPMNMGFVLENVKDSYFIGDPTVKVYPKPSEESDCLYIGGGQFSSYANFKSPTCALLWDTDSYETLSTAKSGSELRGEFTAQSTTIPYSFGYVFTSPIDGETKFYPVESNTFEPTLAPPGQIEISINPSRDMRDHPESIYYTKVGKYFPAVVSIKGDIPDIDYTYQYQDVNEEGFTSRYSHTIRPTLESTSVYQRIPMTVTVKYADHTGGDNSLNIDFISIPTGLVPKLEQPELPLAGQPFELTATLNRYTREGLAPYDKSISGEWDVQLFKVEGKTSSPVGSPVPLADDGSALFTVTSPDPTYEKYKVIAYARPPAGITFVKELSSRSVGVNVADGSPIEGSVVLTKPSGAIPFTGTAVFAPKDSRRANQVARIDWYRSLDGGAFDLITDETGRNVPYEMNHSGKVSYKAVVFNKYSGEQFETPVVDSQGYRLPIIEVVRDTTTFVNHDANLAATVLNGLDTEFTWEYRFGYRGETQTHTGSSLTLNSPETGTYHVKLISREVGAPADDYSSAVVHNYRLSVNNPGVMRPAILLGYSMEIGTPQEITFTEPQLTGGLNSQLNLLAEAILPNGQVIPVTQDQTISYTPTMAELDNGKFNFEYSVWVEGLKEETLNTTRKQAYGWVYAWPQWEIYARKTEAEAPARLTFTLKQKPFDNPHESLGHEELTIEWLNDGGEISYVNDKDFSVLYPTPGQNGVQVTVSDTRGNTATIDMSDINLLEGPPFKIDAIAGNTLTDWVAPTYVIVKASTNSISAYDSVANYQYFLNGQELTDVGSTNRASVRVNVSGEHSVLVRATSANGDVSEKLVPFTALQNSAPVCEIIPYKNSDGSIYRFKAACTDSDNYIVDFQWTFNGQVLEGSSAFFNVDSESAQNIQSVSVKATDTKDGFTIVDWQQ